MRITVTRFATGGTGIGISAWHPLGTPYPRSAAKLTHSDQRLQETETSHYASYACSLSSTRDFLSWMVLQPI
jgi:hypothetical protein